MLRIARENPRRKNVKTSTSWTYYRSEKERKTKKEKMEQGMERTEIKGWNQKAQERDERRKTQGSKRIVEPANKKNYLFLIASSLLLYLSLVFMILFNN